MAATLENETYSYRGDPSCTASGLTVKRVVSDGGSEGEGESVYRVYAVIKDGVEIAWFSCCGYYASEYGTDFEDDFTSVYPRQVLVTQYHTTKE